MRFKVNYGIDSGDGVIGRVTDGFESGQPALGLRQGGVLQRVLGVGGVMVAMKHRMPSCSSVRNCSRT